MTALPASLSGGLRRAGRPSSLEAARSPLPSRKPGREPEKSNPCFVRDNAVQVVLADRAVLIVNDVLGLPAHGGGTANREPAQDITKSHPAPLLGRVRGTPSQPMSVRASGNGPCAAGPFPDERVSLRRQIVTPETPDDARVLCTDNHIDPFANVVALWCGKACSQVRASIVRDMKRRVDLRPRLHQTKILSLDSPCECG